MLGFGALAAAGLATLSQKSIGGFGCTRCQLQVTPPWIAPSHLLHRSQSTLSGLFSSISSGTTHSAMADLKPPQAAPSWTHSPEDVRKIAKESLDKHKALVDKISALPAEQCNFETVRSRAFPL